MNPQDLFDLVSQKKWLALSSILIWFIVRLLKSDTKIPINLPPRWRAITALLFGVAAGMIDKFIVSGYTTWTVTILQGVGVGVLAVLIHTLLIDGLRDGKEPIVPGLILPGVSPGPGKPPSIPVPPMTFGDGANFGETRNSPLNLPSIHTPIMEEVPVTIIEPPITQPELPAAGTLLEDRVKALNKEIAILEMKRAGADAEYRDFLLQAQLEASSDKK